MTTKCNAKKPTTCRYHGSLSNLQDAVYDASTEYFIMISAFNPSRPSPETIEAAKQKFVNAQASLDAHDKSYVKLVAAINKFDETHHSTWDTSDNINRMARKSLTDRKALADAIRTKVKNPLISTKAEADANPVKARVEKADAELTLVQNEIHDFNKRNPDYTGDMLKALALGQPVPTSSELQTLGNRLNAADEEQTAAKNALNEQYRSTQILDRNDPEFLKTLDRKGFNRY